MSESDGPRGAEHLHPPGVPGVSAGERISAFLSDTSPQILTRIMGLLLASIAMQMLFAGLGKGFPGLTSSG